MIRITKVWALVKGERVELDPNGTVTVEWSDGSAIELAPTTSEELQAYSFREAAPAPARQAGMAMRFNVDTLYLRPHSYPEALNDLTPLDDDDDLSMYVTGQCTECYSINRHEPDCTRKGRIA